MTIMAFTFFARSANAAAMIIDETRVNTIQDHLVARTLSFSIFDIAPLFTANKAEAQDNAGVLFGLSADEIAHMQEQERKAVILDTYFDERSMPLKGYGMKFVEESEKHGLDWRLLPAIAIRESSGGKFACDSNPFGWASCKADFDSTEQAIEMVAWNLGGHNSRTKQYYSGTAREKLHRYNGTVIRGYEDQVLRIMDKIAEE